VRPPLPEEFALDRLGFYDWNDRWGQTTADKICEYVVLSAFVIGFLIMISSIGYGIGLEIRRRRKRTLHTPKVDLPRARVVQ
jgi:hypothetical protein